MFEVIRRMDKIEVAKCDCGGLISWDEDDFYTAEGGEYGVV